ncbi:MAG: GldG family protein [Acidobacteriia bacterium]|nr:GldG family protein [Terriglobia bacterium]
MRGAVRFLGFAGLVLLVFGLVSYALTGSFDLWTAVHVAGGGVLVAAGILLNLAGFRRTVSLEGTRRRLSAVLGALLFGGIVVAANVLAARHPMSYDATERKIHTLSEQTRAVLSRLDRPVELLEFAGAADPQRGEIAELLSRYSALSPRVTWRFVDAEQDPALAERYHVSKKGIIVARSGETSAESTGDREDETLSEGVVTNLVLKVTRPGPRTVYLLAGHGEAAPDDAEAPGGAAALAEALRRENFEVRPLLLAAQSEVPRDAALLAAVGPRKPLLDHEVSAIRAYLGRGGRLLLLVDPGVDPGLSPLLADFRLALVDDMVVDREEIPFLGARLGLDPIVEDFPTHAITREFKERIVLFQARSVDAKTEGGLPGVEARAIARTRPSSWAVADYRRMLSTGTVARGPGDVAGPVAVAVAARRAATGAADAAKDPAAAPAASARLVVIGDADLAENAHLDDFFNKEFLLNSIAWLSGQEDLIAERPRGFRASRLDMTEADYRTLFRLGVLLFPESLLIVGLGVWWRRRTL